MKSRQHKILFVADSPFKKRVVANKKKYNRKKYKPLREEI